MENELVGQGGELHSGLFVMFSDFLFDFFLFRIFFIQSGCSFHSFYSSASETSIRRSLDVRRSTVLTVYRRRKATQRTQLMRTPSLGL